MSNQIDTTSATATSPSSLRNLRKSAKLSQANAAHLCGTTQATWSRAESGAIKIQPQWIETMINFSQQADAILTAVTQDPDDAHAAAVGRADSDRSLSVRLQVGAGHILAGLIGRCAPRLTANVIGAQLVHFQAPTKIDQDPNKVEVERIALSAGYLGEELVRTADHISELLQNGDYQLVIALSRAALHGSADVPALEGVRCKVRMNLGAALVQTGQFEAAEAELRAVADYPDRRLKGLAANALGEIQYLRECVPCRVYDTHAQEQFSVCERVFVEAAELLGGRRYPALGLLGLANKAQELGQGEHATRLAVLSEKYLGGIPREELADIRTHAEQRMRWPFLTRRKSFLAKHVPSLAVTRARKRSGSTTTAMACVIAFLLAFAPEAFAAGEVAGTNFFAGEVAGTNARSVLLGMNYTQAIYSATPPAPAEGFGGVFAEGSSPKKAVATVRDATKPMIAPNLDGVLQRRVAVGLGVQQGQPAGSQG